MSVTRDPVTGQFKSVDSEAEIEYATGRVMFSADAADNDGLTDRFYGEEGTFEGHLLYDADELVDRHEVAELIAASHRLTIQPTGTQTADSAAAMVLEVSASPASAVAGESTGTFSAFDDTSGEVLDQQSEFDDTADLVGRPLNVMGQGPFTDGTNGTGGGGSAGEDAVEVRPMRYLVDSRDEFYINGWWGIQNLADGPLTGAFTYQHVLAVRED